MQTYNDIRSLKEHLGKLRREGKTIGFVPTMGFLHEGHQSLIKRAAEENAAAVVSIFVNPVQFGPNEDFEKYPRDLERDIKAAAEAGASVLFFPDRKEIYPEGYRTYVEVEEITGVLCGASRPGHFRGVATVVTKLLNIVAPDRAYFGQKDAQQAIVIQRMVRDLNMDPEIIVCPIIREKDGLAMSSRNVYLTVEEREEAVVLSQALKLAQEMAGKGERDIHAVLSAVRSLIESKPLANIDYVEAVGTETMKPADRLEGRVLLALAVRFGNTRLIDNTILEG